ncbi:hypothetical protein SAMN04490243_0180 [Robiginitalea myxolifaciens]|uniref:Uncharacterized protein n=1 Tax=Robiginitalea myxolifaciens TaxID=400055 RepID=A0A1I6FN18_9FLAO|nr:hypothetical protein [Robiginitalea myxolifaciens]SFR31353.1 hypothetical protein SAMN04490243_0180 [Robiginitalea myxolifaciens]
MINRCWHSIVLLCFLLACGESKVTTEDIAEGPYALQTEVTFIAGAPITLEFSGTPSDQLVLLVDNAWGSTLLAPDDSKSVSFSLPAALAQKAGLSNWYLVAGQTVLDSGEYTILPAKPPMPTLETYIGPPSIFANGLDQSMLVALPQDQYGNALQDSTPVRIRTLFRNQQEETRVNVNRLIAYDYIATRPQAGELFIAASADTQVSKELTVRVLASLPTDFEIEAIREHTYADGNQIVTLRTSPIQDSNGNSIADGTLVNFQVKNILGPALHAQGQTVNGVARANLLHPQQADTWEVSAYISGLAKSNSIGLEFEPAVADFSLLLSGDGRELQITSIQSYMEQLIPDGLTVSLTILDAMGKPLYTDQSRTFAGKASFDLTLESIEDASVYRISVGGVTKEIIP